VVETSLDRSHSREAIVLFSGGIDSTACVHFLKAQNFAVRGLFIDYSQAAADQERRAVKSLAPSLSIRVSILRIAGLESSGPGELIGRNGLLISAAFFASKGRICTIATGIHAGTAYYDCSARFLNTMNLLALVQTDGRVSIFNPFADWNKQDVYDYATAENLPLDRTYSCESGTFFPCGRCASCRDREALRC
jgi:7-cyano-7-deazaguanine synthase